MRDVLICVVVLLAAVAAAEEHGKFAYDDFDATPNVAGRRKSWTPHLKDYDSEADDLLWGPQRDQGKALLGAVNYLSGKGMNVFSFLTFNVAGDDENVTLATLALALLVVGPGCLSPGTITCASGRICPEDMVCDDERRRSLGPIAFCSRPRPRPLWKLVE